MTSRNTGRQFRHVLLGNPSNRRVAFFQDALRRLGLSQARVVSYRELLDGNVTVDELFENTDLVRIDSPGEDFSVEKLLIARGAAHPELGGCEQISRAAALALQQDEGRLRFTRQCYIGYRCLLREISEAHARHPHVWLYNTPGDIELMFDKPRCQQLLRENGIPVPDMLDDVLDYDELLSKACEQSWTRLFIKMAHGSSASGVIALNLSGAHRRAVTTIEMVKQPETRLYNNLKLQTYTDEGDIRRIIDYVCAETAQVERWMPKASLAGRTFDLRILVINGEACHTVVRTSSTPITNLHLGNRRGDLSQLKAKLEPDQWLAIKRAAEGAAQQFTDSLCVAVDLLIGPSFRDPLVLETNAFGDLLPGIQFSDRDAYEAQILARCSGTNVDS